MSSLQYFCLSGLLCLCKPAVGHGTCAFLAGPPHERCWCDNPTAEVLARQHNTPERTAEHLKATLQREGIMTQVPGTQ